MTSVVQPFEINSESSFFELLEQVLFQNGEMPANLVFKGWPFIEINVKGERYHSTLPVSLMEGLVEFQKRIYRAYAIIKYKTNDVRCLTDKEKASLELVFKVSEGSSDAKADGDGVLNKVLDCVGNVMSNMDSQHKAIVLGLFVLSVAGYYGFSSYTAKEIEQIKANKDVEVARITAEAAQNQAKSNEHTVDVMASLVSKKVDVKEKVMAHMVNNADENQQEVIHQMHEGYKAVVKGAEDADKITFKTTELDKTKIAEVIAKPTVVKEKSSTKLNITIDGFKRHSIDGDIYRFYVNFNVTDVGTGISFTMRADSGTTSTDEFEKLYRAASSAGSQLQVLAQLKSKNGIIESAKFQGLPTEVAENGQ